MSWEQWIQSVKLLKSIWTKSDFLCDEFSVNVWYKLLQDIPFDIFCLAVERYALTSTFPPSVAELREQVVKLQADPKDWSEGWHDLMTAVRRYGYCNEKDALESMSPLTRDVVKRIGWQYICESGVDELTAIRANFRMIYQQHAETAKEQMQLSQDFKQKINKLLERNELLIE